MFSKNIFLTECIKIMQISFVITHCYSNQLLSKRTRKINPKITKEVNLIIFYSRILNNCHNCVHLTELKVHNQTFTMSRAISLSNEKLFPFNRSLDNKKCVGDPLKKYREGKLVSWYKKMTTFSHNRGKTSLFLSWRQ